MKTIPFTQILPDVYLFKDFVNVYVIKYDHKAILIDFGSGKIIENLHRIGVTKGR